MSYRKREVEKDEVSKKICINLIDPEDDAKEKDVRNVVGNHDYNKDSEDSEDSILNETTDFSEESKRKEEGESKGSDTNQLPKHFVEIPDDSHKLDYIEKFLLKEDVCFYTKIENFVSLCYPGRFPRTVYPNGFSFIRIHLNNKTFIDQVSKYLAENVSTLVWRKKIQISELIKACLSNVEKKNLIEFLNQSNLQVVEENRYEKFGYDGLVCCLLKEQHMYFLMKQADSIYAENVCSTLDFLLDDSIEDDFPKIEKDLQLKVECEGDDLELVDLGVLFGKLPKIVIDIVKSFKPNQRLFFFLSLLFLPKRGFSSVARIRFTDSFNPIENDGIDYLLIDNNPLLSLKEDFGGIIDQFCQLFSMNANEFIPMANNFLIELDCGFEGIDQNKFRNELIVNLNLKKYGGDLMNSWPMVEVFH